MSELLVRDTIRVRILQITNPIRPREGRIVRHVDGPSGRRLSDFLFAHVWHYTREEEGDAEKIFAAWSETVLVSLNGHVWERSLWTEITPKDGDCIVISPIVRGGGLLKTLATIAVIAASAALIATGAGAALGGAILGTTLAAGSAAAGIANAVLAGAVTIAGNLLIGAVFNNQPSNKGTSPSYDPDGPRSLAQSGVVIPKGYGTFMWGGNIISSFTEINGSDQFINVLVCFGFGPARSITGIEINGKSIYSYNNVSYEIRLGTNNQTEIQNFNQIVNGYPQDTQCLAGTAVVVPGTGDLTEALYVDVQFPSGLFVMTSIGNMIPAVITYQVQYAVSGTNNWQPVLQPQTTAPLISQTPDGSPYMDNSWAVIATDFPRGANIVYTVDNGPHNPGDPWTGTISVEVFQPNGNHSTYNKTCTGVWQPIDINMNYTYVLTWTEGYVDFVACQNTPCYNRTQILGLAPGKYDVQIIKYGTARLHDDVSFGDNWSPNIGQDMWVHEVSEISYLDLIYPNMILIGVRALATSQLSGTNINITAVIEHGLRSKDQGLMPAQLEAFEEDNPACVAADMMLDDLYGGGAWPGITAANLERYIDDWVAWAENNDTLVPDGNGGDIRMCVFNGIFDNESDLWTQLGVVGAMSRASIVQAGTDYTVVLDTLVDAPVQMFSVGNTIQDSFSETFQQIDERANQVEIQFADSTRYYRQDNPLVYMDPANQEAGVIPKISRIRGTGITVPAQAWHHARYKERGNQFLIRTGSLKTDTDGIACRPFNVIALQSDVPQWGYGGRTLPGSLQTVLLLDRHDLPFVAGTAYSVMVQHADVQRFSGPVSAVATSTSPPGYTLTIAGWANTQRITRAIVNGQDCAVLESDVNSVTIAPTPGFVPANGQTAVLHDTDVLDSATVASVTIEGEIAQVTLSTPLQRTPSDYSNYIYGPTGAVKWTRVTNFKRADWLRSTLEWIDYDARVYDVATPVIGETSAIVKSNPGVTQLIGSEQFQKVGTGSYITFATLSWKNGPDTAGVGIYASYPGGTSLPQLVARIPGNTTSWTAQQAVGSTVEYIVVGYDANNRYADITTAPTATITAEGVTANLLLGSSFQSGFTYWNITPRAGDTFAPTFADDGEALYTVAGSALGSQGFAYQAISPSKWAVGDYLMLSAYVMDTCVSPSAPNVGMAQILWTCYDASGATLATFGSQQPLNGTQPTLTRFFSAVGQIPANTAAIVVAIGTAPNPSNVTDIPVGSTIAFSHLLLEIGEAGQTEPSAWADLDVTGQVLDIFQSGSSSGLRVQGSVLPTFTGNFGFTSTSASLTITWTSLLIAWPDGSLTTVQNGSLTFTGLTASTTYWAFLYFDVVNGGVALQVPASPVGTPAQLGTAYDTNADQACKQDNRVALTPGGMQMTTAATGAGPGSGTGGGTNPGKPPIGCTVWGTELRTPEGPVSNITLKERFDAGEDVFLVGRNGPERIKHAEWMTVREYYAIELEGHGFHAFGCSPSHMVMTEDGYRWIAHVLDGTPIETTDGFRLLRKHRILVQADVLKIELEGPSHEYLVVEGVWTHNFKYYPYGDSGL